MTTEFRIQVNFKTPTGTLINLRADSGAEMDGMFEYLASRLGVIMAAEQELSGTGAAAAGLPLAPPAQQMQAQPAPQPPMQPQWGQQAPATSAAPSTWGAPQMPAPLPAPPQQVPYSPQGAPSGVSGAAPSQAGPVCNHGQPAKYVNGGVNKSGKPYRAFWACAMDRDHQCDFRANA